MDTIGKIPEIKRTARATESRETTSRRKPWAPPSRLDAPEPPPGYKHRWLRMEAGGQEDRINISGKIREGYELVRSDEYPDFHVPSVEDGRYAGIISVGGMVLARIPEETAEERNAYYRSRAQDQVTAADNDLMKTNAHNSMRIDKPVRQSKVTFGGPKAES